MANGSRSMANSPQTPGSVGGADVLFLCLEALGASTVFGVPGTQNVPLFEGLRRSKLRTILGGNELSAAFMANGYFRSSGVPGILTTIPGPGFTYALTGLAEARHDSAAVIHLVITPKRTSHHRFQLQELDLETIAMSIFKEVFRVENAHQLPGILEEAWTACLADEPGPVFVAIQDSVLAETLKSPRLDLPGSPGAALPDPSSLASAVSRIFEAKRLMVFLGQGSVQSASVIREFVESFGAVVVSNSSGRGVIPENHSRSLCSDFSGWGIGLLNELVTTSDLVLALGCKFSHNGTSGFQLRLPPEKLVHVDSSAEILSGNYPASLPVRADIGEFMTSVMSQLSPAKPKEGGWNPDELAGWKDRFSQERLRSTRPFPKLTGGGQGSLIEFFELLRTHLPDDAILVTDSGLHQMAARRLFEVRAPRGLIVPSDFQSMGFGLPAAIGAALAAPTRKVVAIVGDGGMAMSGLELATAVREGIDLTVIVFNDGHLGQIRLQQLRDYGKPHATRLGGIQFEHLAASVGASYVAMDGTNLEVLEKALSNPGVTLVDLLLTDSASVRRIQTTSLIRASARKVLHPRIWTFLKRVIGKGSS